MIERKHDCHCQLEKKEGQNHNQPWHRVGAGGKEGVAG